MDNIIFVITLALFLFLIVYVSYYICRHKKDKTKIILLVLWLIASIVLITAAIWFWRDNPSNLRRVFSRRW
ncbi:MAG: hypothetical protein FWC80_02330 [Firmicutes bacterium]|nr:hypothetical protein [Bacillota bacterium]